MVGEVKRGVVRGMDVVWVGEAGEVVVWVGEVVMLVGVGDVEEKEEVRIGDVLYDSLRWWCGEPGPFVEEVRRVGLLLLGSQRPVVLVVLWGLVDLIAEVPRLGEWTGVRRRKGFVGGLDWAMDGGLYWNWTGCTLSACLTVAGSLARLSK